MLAVKVNSPDPALATAGMALEELLFVVPVAVELEVDERVPVDVTEAVGVC